MAREAAVVEQLQEQVDAATGGVACPFCGGVTGVLYRKSPRGHYTRRRVCGRCNLRVTTVEKIVGGLTQQQIERAALALARWCKKRPADSLAESSDESRIRSIQPTQGILFKDAE